MELSINTNSKNQSLQSLNIDKYGLDEIEQQDTSLPLLISFAEVLLVFLL